MGSVYKGGSIYWIRYYRQEATGNVLNALTEKTKDHLGGGIPGSFQIGKHRIYPVDGIVQAIRDRRVVA